LILEGPENVKQAYNWLQLVLVNIQDYIFDEILILRLLFYT